MLFSSLTALISSARALNAEIISGARVGAYEEVDSYALGGGGAVKVERSMVEVSSLVGGAPFRWCLVLVGGEGLGVVAEDGSGENSGVTATGLDYGDAIFCRNINLPQFVCSICPRERERESAFLLKLSVYTILLHHQARATEGALSLPYSSYSLEVLNMHGFRCELGL